MRTSSRPSCRVASSHPFPAVEEAPRAAIDPPAGSVESSLPAVEEVLGDLGIGFAHPPPFAPLGETGLLHPGAQPHPVLVLEYSFYRGSERLR